ncbi:DUF5103 domain-containing protein [Cryomorpha ignava]|uniref:DUF5103 domain-containing protein n=1 Tax=Cryomorpha ignava TaxID=101383 RepID=A0A7K3WQ26_9FLAO|nr:DUF5103 domain-containing protein [Cryomorpha ignava]NEN23594.1 DUF5103 domain-containing protein [Cryomorpha ignava]
MNPTIRISIFFLATGLALSFCTTGKTIASGEKNSTGNEPKMGTASNFLEERSPPAQTYTNQIFDPKVKTMLLYTSKSELNPPIIQLNGTEQIILKFDDLGENARDMYYRFEHCTHDWKSSELHLLDYQEGYNTDFISDYQFSFNTIQPFTHYSLAFPNDRIQLTKSGNYVVKVYADDDEKQPILTARFMIVEPLATVSGTIKRPSVISERDYRQKVDINVNLNGVGTLNPYSEIELVVLQNNRLDNAIRGIKPSFIKGRELIYDFQSELTFDGINEFRNFDAKSVRYRSERVTEVDLMDNGYHIYLSPDIRRAFKQYSFDQDINGKLLIKNDDMQNAHLESDYVTVHFTMPVDAFLGNGDMYLFGQLSNWEMDDRFKMDYNPLDLRYEKSLKLKQGYYNYIYLWKYKSQESGTTELTEGNYFETENNYTILLYYKDRSTFSDRLVGYKVINTLKN